MPKGNIKTTVDLLFDYQDSSNTGFVASSGWTGHATES
jgi:hypothetical protein